MSGADRICYSFSPRSHMRMEALAPGFAVEGPAGSEHPAACPAQVMAAAAADQEVAAEVAHTA